MEGDDAPEPVLHEYSFHNLSPEDVLHGDMAIQTLDRVSAILKVQYNLTYGCLPPTYLYGTVKSSIPLPREYVVPAGVRSVQIHFVYDHFVVSAQQNNTVAVYDLLRSAQRVAQVRPQLELLYQVLQTSDAPRVQYVVPQFQVYSELCGAFATANCLFLLCNMQPNNHYLDASKMRQHMYNCLCHGIFSVFPEILMTTRYQGDGWITVTSKKGKGQGKK